MTSQGPEGVSAEQPIRFPNAADYGKDDSLSSTRFHALKIAGVLDDLLNSNQIQTQHRRLTAAVQISVARDELAPYSIEPYEWEGIDPHELENPYDAARFATSLLLQVADSPIPNFPKLERDIKRHEPIAIATHDLSLMSSERRSEIKQALFVSKVIGLAYEIFGERDPRPDRPGKHVQVLPKY